MTNALLVVTKSLLLCVCMCVCVFDVHEGFNIANETDAQDIDRLYCKLLDKI